MIINPQATKHILKIVDEIGQHQACISQDPQNKPGVLPEGPLNKLRRFIKHNYYGQYIAFLLMSIMTICNIVVYGYHQQGVRCMFY